MMKKAAVHNLGCKVNSYELDIMVQELKGAGYEMVPFDEMADLYIINTCTVTSIADRKSRQMLHKAKHTNPDAVVVAVGCYVETDLEKLEKDPLVDLCIGNNHKGNLAALLKELDRKPSGCRRDQKILPGSMLRELGTTPAFEPQQLEKPMRTRADIKIQDGCNQFCTYCIIPYARGRIRSRDPAETVEEVKRLAGRGVQEIVLTGVHVSSYGLEKKQKPEDALLDLLKRLQMIAGIKRIRLSSLEPRIMTEEFIQGIAGLSKICPHFHLSLQSGCDATLKRMNRQYTTGEYSDSVSLLRTYFDRPAITTDVITGFPGETQQEFDETIAFLKKIGFYEIHVFKYSPRRGTPAEHFPNPCSPNTKAQRSACLLELTAQQAGMYRRSFLGEQEELLLEERIEVGGTAYYTGHTMRYVEGIVPAGDHSEGEIVQGIFTDIFEGERYLRMQEQEI